MPVGCLVRPFRVFPLFSVPGDKRIAMHASSVSITEQPWLVHFGMWSADWLVRFLHAAMLECEYDEGEEQLSLDHAQAVVEAAIDCCERYYPVFQFVLWGGKSPSDALAASLVETVGEA